MGSGGLGRRPPRVSAAFIVPAKPRRAYWARLAANDNPPPLGWRLKRLLAWGLVAAGGGLAILLVWLRSVE